MFLRFYSRMLNCIVITHNIWMIGRAAVVEDAIIAKHISGSSNITRLLIAKKHLEMNIAVHAQFRTIFSTLPNDLKIRK